MPLLMQTRIPLASLLQQQHTLHSHWAYLPTRTLGCLSTDHPTGMGRSQTVILDLMLWWAALLFVAPPVYPGLPAEFWSVYFPTWFVILGDFVRIHSSQTYTWRYRAALGQYWAQRDPTCDKLCFQRRWFPPPSSCSQAPRSPPTAQTPCLSCHTAFSLGGRCEKPYQKSWRHPSRKSPPFNPHPFSVSWVFWSPG